MTAISDLISFVPSLNVLKYLQLDLTFKKVVFKQKSVFLNDRLKRANVTVISRRKNHFPPFAKFSKSIERVSYYF